MDNIQHSMKQLFNYIQQKDPSKTTTTFIFDLFFTHVFLEAFFFTHHFKAKTDAPKQKGLHPKFIRCQGIHAFRTKEAIPGFLKREFVFRQTHSRDSININQQFDQMTDPQTHFQRVPSEFFENVPEIKDLQNTLKYFHENKSSSDGFVSTSVLSKSAAKKLKNKLNNSFVLKDWNSCHGEFIKTLVFPKQQVLDDLYWSGYKINKDTVVTDVIELTNIIELLMTVPLEQLKTSIAFLDHVGKFDPKELFGMDHLMITGADINSTFPTRKRNIYSCDKDDTYYDPCFDSEYDHELRKLEYECNFKFLNQRNIWLDI